jgi:hypothetical protein
LESGGEPSAKAVRTAYESFIKDNDYLEAVSRSTADQTQVSRRLEKTKAAFSRV